MKLFLSTLVLLVLSSPFILAQDCDCTVMDVEANMVIPCDYSVGTEIIVSSESEFITAVNQANSSGGNVTILIADGTYQVASASWYPYITGSNVVFRSLSGNRDAVVLTGSGMMNTDPATEIGIYALGDNITIANLTIKDVGNHGIAVTGDNLFVFNVKIQNTFEQMIKGNSSGNGINNGQVKCSLFEYTAGIGPQWYIGGLDIHTGINWTVSDNVFKDIASPSQAVAEHAIHFWDSSADNIIERNTIINCDRGIGFGLGSSPNTGGIIKNNMITNDGSNLFHDVGIGVETSPNTKIFNNTIFINYQNAIEYRFAATTNVEVTNNLTNQAITSRNDGQAIESNNVEDAIEAWFINTTTDNLRLATAVESVVDMGMSLSEVLVDIDNNSRPINESHDIGAYEYPSNVSINEFSTSTNNISIFPQPASDIFVIKSASNHLYKIEIYNACGQKIWFNSETNLINGHAISTNYWPNGVYHGRAIEGNNIVESFRIIVVN